MVEILPHGNCSAVCDTHRRTRVAAGLTNPRLRLLALISFLALLLVCGLAAQETLKVNVAVVNVPVRVTDQTGRVVHGLTAKDFALFENGELREIVHFSSEELPVSLVILLDRSDSMATSGKLHRAKEAASLLVKSSHPGTEFLYLAFDGMISPGREFQQEQSITLSQIERTVLGEGTRLYDAVIESLRRCVQARQPRQALVVITDGADQMSASTLDEVIAKLRQSPAQVYLIGYFSSSEDFLFRESGRRIRLMEGFEIDNPRVVFRRLAQESGAEAFFPGSPQELLKSVQSIASDYRQQYTLAFYPPPEAFAGAYRTLSVRVNRPGVRIRARPGYTIFSKPGG